MEGLSIISYKNKSIMFIDFSVNKTKEKTLELINAVGTESEKYPPKSILVLVNAAGFTFDMDVLNVFKDMHMKKAAPHQKKMAVIGMKGLIKAAYNMIVGLTQNDSSKIFDSELEAKEWLVKD